MDNKSFNKFISMYSFFNSFVNLMSIIPKSNIFTVIVKDTRLSHSRFARVTNNISNSRFNITSLDFRSMNIETIFRSLVNMIFNGFKFFLTKVLFKKGKQSSLKTITKYSIRKKSNFFQGVKLSVAPSVINT